MKVKVKLTDRGLQIVNHQIKLLSMTATSYREPKFIKPDKAGMVEFTLEALMDVFGVHVLGGHQLFADDAIHLVPEAAQ